MRRVLPLLLLPAMLCDAELYREQTERLRGALIFPVAETSLETSAQSILRQAPPRFALAGTSAGGNLALEILAQAPERVAGLWLMGSNPGLSADPASARRMNERVRGGEFEAVVDELGALAVHADGPRGAEAAATLRRMAHRTGPERFVRQNDAMITRHDRWGALDGLRAPTLLLWGRHDQFASVERAQEIASRVPAARLLVLDDCGHLPTLEYPEASTAAAREWLEQCGEPLGAD
jgi:pimeloyl-ACP methyl ester carboxylesterase